MCGAGPAAVPVRVSCVVTEVGVIESDAAWVGEDAVAEVSASACFAGVERTVDACWTGLNAAAAWTDAGVVVSGTSSAVWPPPPPRRWAGRSASTASAEANSAPAVR